MVLITPETIAGVGQLDVVAIDRGQLDHINNGDTLSAWRTGSNGLPDEKVGLVMAFKTFEEVSYALVMEASSGISKGGVLKHP